MIVYKVGKPFMIMLKRFFFKYPYPKFSFSFSLLTDFLLIHKSEKSKYQNSSEEL